MNEINLYYCSCCKIQVEKESELQDSHDVPRYLFVENKNEADKYGRRRICKKCHDIYERKVMGFISRNLSKEIRMGLIPKVKNYANYFFNNGGYK